MLSAMKKENAEQGEGIRNAEGKGQGADSNIVFQGGLFPVPYFFFFLTSLLEYNCFTMVC